MNNMDSSALIAGLQDEIHKSLFPHVPVSGKFALLDFPNYANVGDSAIWLGQIEYFSRKHNARPAYVSNISGYSPADLRRALPDGPIFLSGGGNFGDLWPHHQRFRETVLQDFPDRPVIQLPQSLHFKNPEDIKRASLIMNRHPDFTLFVRDNQSHAIAQENFSSAVKLCPDMAFFIGSIEKPVEPSRPVLLLLRTDHERKREDVDLAYPQEDWLTESRFLKLAVPFETLGSAMRAGALSRQGCKEVLYRKLAENRVDRGLRQLSSARFVITDRLHVHILCLLLDLPHVFLDNSYGKIGNFARLWTENSTISRREDSLAEAIAYYESRVS